MGGEINFKTDLNPDQYAAVVSPPDVPTLVLAGAGSGKTRTLTYRVAWLIKEKKISPHNLMLLTFTNKAAKEMLERVKSISTFNPMSFWGGTFHSLGNRFLRIEGHHLGLSADFTIADSEDSEKLLKHSVEELIPSFFSKKENPKTKLLKEIISYTRNTCLPFVDSMYDRFPWIETDADEIEKISKHYEMKKRKANICDFDDLLELWYKILFENESVRLRYAERFENILVDEYQDTNLLQCEILDLLASTGRISAVGDDAQCIYSWRGANIENILNFKDRYPNGVIYKVEQNYRSSPQILDFANNILLEMNQSKDFQKVLNSTRPSAKKPIVIRAIDSSAQARVVADLISELTCGTSAPYKLSDIAILYRAHFQAMDMQLHMQYRNISFAITSGLKFFEQAHIKDIVSQMRFAANPNDSISFFRFIRFLPKIGDKTAVKIFEKIHEVSQKKKITPFDAMSYPEVISKVPESSREIFASLSKTVSELNEAISYSKGNSGKILAEQFNLFEEKRETKVLLPKDMVRASCDTWYLDCMKTMYEDWQDRFMDFDSLYEYASRFNDIEQFLVSASLEISDSEHAENGEAKDKVRMMTVHQAKGLEFPVVFVIGASDGLFPLERCIEDGTVEEERRLFYVASTRAKELLVITYPRISMMKGSSVMLDASRFLTEIKPTSYERNY